MSNITESAGLQPPSTHSTRLHAGSLSFGTAVRLVGSWQSSAGSKQRHELKVSSVQILGDNDAESSPVQAKYQTAEYLRTIPHLRPRIPANALLLRLRSQVIASLTNFFHDEGFVQTHTPIITSSDCEGAGEVFLVSSNAAAAAASVATDNVEQDKQKETGWHGRSDVPFFRTPKYLTVSAQLHLEALAQAVSQVWTLSPTFRAEKSDTPRHLSEFYMLEAEMCFVDDMDKVMDVVEAMLQTVAANVRASAIGKELLQQRHASSSIHDHDADAVIYEHALQQRWDGMASKNWPRISYVSAMRKLEAAQASGQTKFAFTPSYEDGLQAEHERFIAETVGQGQPVFVTDYPRTQKPFYMTASGSTKNSSGDAETVACFDLLVPDVCELAGGSMREWRLKDLQENMKSKGLVASNLEWYQDLRRYGSVPHGGFGLGFDRLLCYLSGIGSIRDVVAFPRYYGRCDC